MYLHSVIVSDNQMRLDDLLQSIDVSIADNQPKSDWRKRMDTREENWEAFRSKLFEEVVMYSSMPADSVSYDDHKDLFPCILYYRLVLCVVTKVLKFDVISAALHSTCAISVMS